MRHRQRHAGGSGRQQGIVLVVALILLMVMMVLSLAAVRMSSNEERMVGHLQDRSLTFQAVEAALSEVEERLTVVAPQPRVCGDFSVTQVTVRACPAPTPGATPRWLDNSFDQWAKATPVGPQDRAITPQYFVEYLGNDFPCGTQLCSQYRITARAGGNGRAAVTLQSTFRTD